MTKGFYDNFNNIDIFRVYKGWYYGFYINVRRNITIDSCSSIDSYVGIFTFVIGPSRKHILLLESLIIAYLSLAVTHLAYRSRVSIKNSLVVGSVTPNDCLDQVDVTSNNIRSSSMARPAVSSDITPYWLGSRSGIVFPTFSPVNNMPNRLWTGISNYPSRKYRRRKTNGQI